MGHVSSIALNCGIGHRCGLDLALLWLWHRLAATALIRPLPWEPPYGVGVAPKKPKKKKKKKREVNSAGFVYTRVLDIVLSTFLEVIQRFSL